MSHKCECCDYSTSILTNYKKHMTSEKHKKTEQYKQSNIIKIKKKYKCKHCNNIFDSLPLIEIHIKQDCEYDMRYNNFYMFNEEKLGINIFKNSITAGDIYILQTDFSVNDVFKIGITSNLERRLKEYRTGSNYEPKLHYYFPCKDIRSADTIMKNALKEYNVKREIFKGNIEKLREIILEKLSVINGNIIFSYKADIKTGDVCECAKCDKVYMTKSDLVDHNQLIHQEEILKNNIIANKSNFTCKHCNTIVSSSSGLIKHSRACVAKHESIQQVKLLTEELANKNLINTQLEEELRKKDLIIAQLQGELLNKI